MYSGRPIQYHQPRGIAPRWQKSFKRTTLKEAQIHSKREKNDMLTWNRRLAKAGKPARVGADEHRRYNRWTRQDGIYGGEHSTYALPIVEARPELEYLQSYRIRKDRSTNGYRKNVRDFTFTDEARPDTVFWVEDIRTGGRVTDPAILKAVADVANDNAKWPYRLDEPTKLDEWTRDTYELFSSAERYQGEYTIGKPSRRSRKGLVTFDKPGPSDLRLHQLGLVEECACDRCRPE